MQNAIHSRFDRGKRVKIDRDMTICVRKVAYKMYRKLVLFCRLFHDLKMSNRSGTFSLENAKSYS